jgi:hypothetical protein
VSPVRPRLLVHRGRHEAAGVLLDTALLGVEQARARALALWAPGVRVFALDGQLLVAFPRPRPLDAGTAPGHLVLPRRGLLLAAPLSDPELDALGAPPDAVVTVRGGRAAALVRGEEQDPSAWLGLSPEWVPVEPLGTLVPAPAPPAPPPAPELRGALGVGAAAPGAARAAAAIAAATSRPQTGGGGTSRSLGALGRTVAAIGARLREELSLLATAFGEPAWTRASGAATLPATPPSAPGPLRRALRRALGRILLVTRIARLAGFRQGAYLGRLLAMFERGDLQDALRHAIPLARNGAADDLPALGTPRPRAALTIDPRTPPPGGNIGLGPQLHAELHRLYRRAFEQLSAQGRLDEAAFVLAELLRADEEAVSFLENKGRLRLAAELAEARGLAPALAVRQWFLAGEPGRAAAIARTFRAFPDAVDRLERTGRRREAEALRLLWAEDLATAGDLEGAVAAARPVEVARPLVAGWIARAVAAGGAAGHALLPAWLELEPSRLDEVRARVIAACADPGDEGPFRRAALVRGLLRARRSPELEILARPVLRATLRDRAAGAAEAAGIDPARLTALAADGALEADLPPPTALRTRPAGGIPSARLAAGDRGTRPAHDAAVLPGGRVLVALGEAGASLRTPDGREVARFDVPAHRLVVSDLGTRALALAPRGEATRVSVLDLDARTARTARDLALRGFAGSFDGTAWLVAEGRSVLLLDTLRDDLRTLWHVPDLPGPATALQRDTGWFTFLTFDEHGSIEGWLYDLPGLTLRARSRDFPCSDDEEILCLGGHSDHRWFGVFARPASGDCPILRAASGRGPAPCPLPGVEQVVGLTGGPAVAAAFRTVSGVEVLALDPATLQPVATVSLAGARDGTVRMDGTRLTACDDQGRVIGIDLAGRRVTHDLRL